MFPRYLQYLLTDFRQTFVTDASWDTDDLITFLCQKVKVQGHTIAAEAHSTRRYRRVQLFIVLNYAHTYFTGKSFTLENLGCTVTILSFIYVRITSSQGKMHTVVVDKFNLV